MYRTPKTDRAYNRAPKPENCVFCDPEEDRIVIEEGKHCQVIVNKFPYEQWDYHDVTEHLLLIPKKHVAGLSELTPTARTEIMDYITRYEGKGYNLYARAVGSPVRTVPGHQHTHLIRVSGKRLKLMLYIKKPHIMHKR